MGKKITGDVMIKKFIPQDLEECLMGLPIANWLISESDEKMNKIASTRPQLMINHIPELKGILEIGDSINIKAYTEMDALSHSKCLPNYMINMIENLMNSTVTSHKTLGCYLKSELFCKYFYSMLIGLDAEIVFKSYMKERRILLSRILNQNKFHIQNYDELIYEFIINKSELDYVYLDRVEIDNEELIYFVGFNRSEKLIKDIKFVIRYPSRRFVRFDLIERIINKSDQILLNNYKDEIDQLSISLKYKEISLKFFDQIFMKLIKEKEE